MGFMDKLFKSQRNTENDGAKEYKGVQWDPLESIDQLDNLIKNSDLKPKVIFKHSTRCGISRMVLRQFEGGYTKDEADVTYYALDLLNYRDVSNAVAQKLQVMHQSPQVIVIRNKQVIHTESHHGIDIRKIQELVKNNQ